jgi:hypothetical protein
MPESTLSKKTDKPFRGCAPKVKPLTNGLSSHYVKNKRFSIIFLGFFSDVSSHLHDYHRFPAMRLVKIWTFYQWNCLLKNEDGPRCWSRPLDVKPSFRNLCLNFETRACTVKSVLWDCVPHLNFKYEIVRYSWSLHCARVYATRRLGSHSDRRLM